MNRFTFRQNGASAISIKADGVVRLVSPGKRLWKNIREA